MMLGYLFSYSQYPTIKTIGKDSVVIMTLKQGNEINNKFSYLNDSIKKINSNFDRYMLENGKRLQSMYDSYNLELNNHKLTKAESDSFRVMYMANKKIYLNAEQDHKREIRNLSIFTLLSFFITVIVASAR